MNTTKILFFILVLGLAAYAQGQESNSGGTSASSKRCMSDDEINKLIVTCKESGSSYSTYYD
jgi:hypothetical protein